MSNRFSSLILQTSFTTGSKIRSIRKRKKIASKELATKCNLSDAALRHYEDGLRQVKEDRLQEIADHLNVNVSALYDRRMATCNDVIHTLFEIESAGLIEPDMSGNSKDDECVTWVLRSSNVILDDAIEQWFRQYERFVNGQISDDDYQNWKDAFPSASTADAQEQTESSNSAESADVLSSDSKVAKPDNPIRKHFLLFQSLESRFVSMNYAQEVPAELQERICSYVNCSAEYLNDRERIKFTPEAPNRAEGENDSNVLFDILDIMDKHTDSEQYRTIQIQLSRIVLYHLAQKGFLTKVLRAKEIPEQKTDYLFEGVKPRFNTMAFGYFYTELAVIRELTGMSYQEMFTGIAGY